MIKLTHAIHETSWNYERIQSFKEAWINPATIRIVHRTVMTTVEGEKIPGSSIRLDDGNWMTVTESPEAIVDIDALALVV